jgi:hypothetical protein
MSDILYWPIEKRSARRRRFVQADLPTAAAYAAFAASFAFTTAFVLGVF